PPLAGAPPREGPGPRHPRGGPRPGRRRHAPPPGPQVPQGGVGEEAGRQVDGLRRGLPPEDDEGRGTPRPPVRDLRQQAGRSLPGDRRQRKETQVTPSQLPLSPRSKELLELFTERILVIDGAMGTMIQQRNLTAQDFGGPELEGCNENLVLTRPDV